MPSGPGPIGDDLIAEIASAIPPPVATFLLTSERSAAGIAAHYRKVLTTAIQIVDTLPRSDLKHLRALLPGVKLVQVIHVEGPQSIATALACSAHADALLLDSGRPDLPVKELGGTGRTHDWTISRLIRERVAVPVFLAGGLRPDNVCAAITAVEPFGVDVCSGVRTNGALDRDKLQAFIGAVRTT